MKTKKTDPPQCRSCSTGKYRYRLS